MSDTAVITQTPLVLHGRGGEHGHYTNRFPLEQRTIVRTLRHQAEQYGSKPWMIYDGVDVLSYREGSEYANRVGNAILDAVGPGKHVGLYLRNQIEFMPAENGALTVGVAVPLNADARGPLLQSQIERADIEVMIVRQDLLMWLEALPSLGATKLVVVTGEGDFPSKVAGVPTMRWDRFVDQPVTLDHPEPEYTDLAVIAFTSGTTGRAKGVMYSHYFHYLFSSILTERLGHTDEDILSSPLPQHHRGAAHLIANASLHCGGTGCLQLRFSASKFWAECARDDATYAFLLGPVAALVDKETPADAVPEHRVKSIYCLPSPPNREEWERKFRTKILRQGWAMTEIFPCVMQQLQVDGVPEDSIGWPVGWFDYGVVDPKDNMVPPGEVGELVFRSKVPYGMFSGYYKDAETTAEAFRNFWFHTGDAASYDENGWLRFRGRMKDRIRRRGEMVTAAEVEYVALLHDSVREAACYGVPAELGEEDVKLDCILSEPLDAADFHQWLTANLPKFAIPRFVEFRDEFPKTPSLRIEKYKLKELPLDRPEVYDSGLGVRKTTNA